MIIKDAGAGDRAAARLSGNSHSPRIAAEGVVRRRARSAVPGAALLAAGVILVFLTFLVPIGEDVEIVWENANVPDVREVLVVVPFDLVGGDRRPIFHFTTIAVEGIPGATVELVRTQDGLVEAVNVSGIDADPGSVLRFRGRTTNRVADGTYTWFTVATNVTGVDFEETGATTHTTTTVEAVSWFFLENPAYLAVAFVLGALLLSSVWGCPHECEPEGSKKGCASELHMETYPCGTAPEDIDDVRTGAQIMAWAASRARKLPGLGATYAEFLKSMPGWVDAAKGLSEKTVGREVYVTVGCRWLACRTRSCWVLWSRRKWVEETTAYGPFKIKPPTGYYTSNADCFGPGLTAEQFYEGFKKAVEGSEEVAEAKTKCEAVCGE